MATTATTLTRRQVAALLDETEVEVKGRDNLTFHPGKAADGSYRYDPRQVADVLRGVAGGEPDANTLGASLMATPLPPTRSWRRAMLIVIASLS